MASSRVACNSFSLGTNTTITITRDKSTYTHTLKYSFNGLTGTIATKTNQISVVWTPPASEFYKKIPNLTSGYGTITCETYSGSTLVGITTCGFYAYAVKSNCVPGVSGAVVDTNASTIAVTGDETALIQYLSKPKATLTATAKNGATIKTIQIENPVGLVATTSPYTFDTVYSDEFKFKATDSRGYSTTETVKVSKYIPYDPCYFDKIPVMARVESTSTTATATLTGYCFKGNFGKVDNTITVKYRYKTSNGQYGSYVNITPTWKSDGTFTATATINGLSLDETYTIEFVVEDKLTSFPVESILGQSVGDVRIAKDYIFAKNNLYIGTKNNTEFRAVKLNRFLKDKHYEANFGVGNAGGGGACAIELYEDGVQVARYDLHKDGFMYNTRTYMSVAEIMSNAPSTVSGGAQGHMIINGGESTAPILLQWGRVTATPSGANVTTPVYVSFSQQFTGLPFVCCDKASGAPATVYANVGDITADGFTIYLQRTNTTATSLLWFAIGNGTDALPE